MDVEQKSPQYFINIHLSNIFIYSVCCEALEKIKASLSLCINLYSTRVNNRLDNRQLNL